MRRDDVNTPDGIVKVLTELEERIIALESKSLQKPKVVKKVKAKGRKP